MYKIMESTIALRVLLIAIMVATTYSAFTEEPRSLTVNEGEPATFHCQHPRATFLVWMLNNASLDDHPPQDVYERVMYDSAGNEVEVLTISALAVVEYNGTVIVCEALFLDGSPPEVSSPAVLRVNIMASNSTAGNNGFDIVPVSSTVANDTDALFCCQNSIAERIHWEINGTALSVAHPEDVIVRIDGSNVGSALHMLSIRGNLHYNLTSIVCVASFTSAAIFQTEPAILSVADGNIGPVTDLVAVNGSRIVLQWSPPFTLDLTGITPDVVYCVDVFNVSGSGGDGDTDNRVLSTCNVMEPEYIFTHDYANPAHDFMFVITPRLNVENAINGTQSEPVFGSFDDHCKPNVYSSPMTNQYVPVNSKENVTYSCSVESGNTVVWVVNGTQVHSDDQFDIFSSLGYFIEPRNRLSNVSTISISDVARSRVNHTDLIIQCLSTVGIETCPGDVHHIVTFGAPTDFTLHPSLMLLWTRPTRVPLEVSIYYTIEINATEDGGMNFRNVTSDTSLSVQFLETLLGDLGSDCVEFEFFVRATNDAGTGPLARIQDTIPISPDVKNISRDLRVTNVDVQSLTVLIVFPPVMPCNDIFSITNYTINIDGATNRVLNPGDVTHGVPLTISNLDQDASSSLTITACNNVNCRTSESRTLNTTDVQTVQAVFFEKRLFLNCSFADNSLAQGCVFKFTVINTNGSDRYTVSRQEHFMCIVASYHRDAYGSAFVMDWEESGEDGSVTLNITKFVMNVLTLEEYTALTGCPVTEATSIEVAVVAGSSVGGAVIIMVLVSVVISCTCTVCCKKKRSAYVVKETHYNLNVMPERSMEDTSLSHPRLQAVSRDNISSPAVMEVVREEMKIATGEETSYELHPRLQAMCEDNSSPAVMESQTEERSFDHPRLPAICENNSSPAVEESGGVQEEMKEERSFDHPRLPAMCEDNSSPAVMESRGVQEEMKRLNTDLKCELEELRMKIKRETDLRSIRFKIERQKCESELQQELKVKSEMSDTELLLENRELKLQRMEEELTEGERKQKKLVEELKLELQDKISKIEIRELKLRVMEEKLTAREREIEKHELKLREMEEKLNNRMTEELAAINNLKEEELAARNNEKYDDENQRQNVVTVKVKHVRYETKDKESKKDDLKALKASVALSRLEVTSSGPTPPPKSGDINNLEMQKMMPKKATTASGPPILPYNITSSSQ